MSDKYFARRVEEFFPIFRDSRENEELKRAMMIFAKEIERDARHLAAELAGRLQHEIFNLKYPEN